MYRITALGLDVVYVRENVDEHKSFKKLCESFFFFKQKTAYEIPLRLVGSDGTDGPTDAAGGYVDGDTAAALAARGLDAGAVLADNDAYHALQAVDGLIVTGPTGTNVNDVAVVLVR